MINKDELKNALKLYLVTDSDILKGRDFYKCIEDAIKAGVTMVQLREKNADGKEFLEKAIKLRQITKKYNVTFVINDRVDIAMIADADGVHVGQSDIDAMSIRKLIGEDKIIGVSARNVEEAKIAKENGVDCIDTLTGFKFIGEKINQFEQNKDRTFVMGYEESYGYLVGTHARDKDGVVSALLISEMAAYYYDKGMTLYEGLQEVYKKYGYYKEELKSITLKGIDGMKQIQNIMNSFRTSDIDEIANIKVSEVRDYKEGINDLPKSDVLKFVLEDGSWIAVRPSGTEPKIKFYFGCNGDNQEIVDDKLDSIIEDITNRVNK